MKGKAKSNTTTEIRVDSEELNKLIDLIADRIVAKLLPA